MFPEAELRPDRGILGAVGQCRGVAGTTQGLLFFTMSRKLLFLRKHLWLVKKCSLAKQL